MIEESLEDMGIFIDDKEEDALMKFVNNAYLNK